jgi:tartrate dehydratase beta subunit/fumarate hydratase class I family protein
MDGYLAAFLDAGPSLVSIGKGNQAPRAVEALTRRGGVFQGTIGGATGLTGFVEAAILNTTKQIGIRA